jgi:type IV pilus assembly protein PilC
MTPRKTVHPKASKAEAPKESTTQEATPSTVVVPTPTKETLAPTETAKEVIGTQAGKKEVQKKEKEQEKPKEQAKPAKKAPKGKSGLQKIQDSLNNFGLGKEKSLFIENLAILLNSGLSVIDALKTIQLELRVKPMKNLVGRIIDQVESGIALWRAMEDQSFFSAYALALIRIGEEAGSLSKNMEYLSVQQEKDRSLRAKVKMAMIYPTIVLTLTLIITLGLAWFVLPGLVGVLLSLNAKLPLVTRLIILIANFFRDHGIVAVPSTLGGLLFFAILCKYTPLRGPAQQAVFRFPGIGTMARHATVARFGVILGSLLRAGVPLVESIRSLADVTDTVYYQRFYYRLAKSIEMGDSFATAFGKLKESKSLIPASVQQLVITGERSGKIADMLMRIADIYEKKAEETAAKLPVILEPMLLIFLGGIVGTVAFAIIVPIYSIVGSVGR